jgi:glycosyltransferase involved in cell wall biosynthesis
MYPSASSSINGIFVQKQTEALLAAGIEAVLVNPVPWVPLFLRWNQRWRSYSQIPRKEHSQNMTVYHPRYVEFPKGWLYTTTAARYYAGVASLMHKLCKKWRPDVIQAHVAYPDGAAAVRIGKKFDIPVVVTIHGLDFHYTLTHSRTCKRNIRRTLRGADRVIMVSEALQKNYGVEQWIDDLDKCRVIYNGVHIADTVADLHSTRQKDNSEFAPVLLTVGFLNRKKGHTYVLKALPGLLKQFPRLTYRIAGDGKERGALVRLATELGVLPHVVFLGALSHKEAMNEMAACDIMVLPSWDEGFGVVYLEAMAHAKPVIGTQGEGAALLIDREKVGMTVPARDADAITHAVSRILGSCELAQSMGQKGRDVVVSQFTWEHNAERTISLYKELCQ